jgi:DNA-binding XRE family transcriptional regulator
VSNRNPTLGQRIRSARERQMPKMSQKRLAELAGVITKTVYNWENDRTVPTGRMGRLVEVLGDFEADANDSDALGKAEIRAPRLASEADTERFVWLLHTRRLTTVRR